jgi:hypothetical protein
MKQITWAVLAAMGGAFAVPAFADDPPAPGSTEKRSQDQEAGAAESKATSTIQTVEIRDGAGSMEPGDTKEADTQSAEDRVERDFVTNVWNSP